MYISIFHLLLIASTVNGECCGSYFRGDCLEADGKPVNIHGDYCGDCASPSYGFGCCGAAGSAGGGHYGCNLFCCNCDDGCRPWCSNCPVIRKPVPPSPKSRNAVEATKIPEGFHVPSTKQKVNAIMRMFDTDQNGKIDFEEFRTAIVGTKAPPHGVESMYAGYEFDKMDRNKDGHLTKKEIDKNYP